MNDESSRIIRVKKDARYFTASNEPFNDQNLSWGARGIMGYLLSKPDNWEVRNKDLYRQSKAGPTAVIRLLKELKENGYLRRYRMNDEAGHLVWVTEIYESKALNPDYQKPATEDSQKDPSTEALPPKSEKPKFGKSDSGSPKSDLPSFGSPKFGSPNDGKPGHIVNTESVNTESIKTERGITYSSSEEEKKEKSSLSFENEFELQLSETLGFALESKAPPRFPTRQAKNKFNWRAQVLSDQLGAALEDALAAVLTRFDETGRQPTIHDFLAYLEKWQSRSLYEADSNQSLDKATGERVDPPFRHKRQLKQQPAVPTPDQQARLRRMQAALNAANDTPLPASR